VFRRGLTPAAILLAVATGCQTQAAAPRYLYVVTCDARVDKLDTVAGRKMASYDLAKASGEQHLIPSAEAGMDGCLAYQAQFDAAVSAFYLVAPVQASIKPDGTKDYRILSFSIPAIQLAKSMPAGSNLTDPPHLELSSGGVPRTLAASEWRPPTEIDLSTFAPSHERLGNQIIESSGDRALLRLFTADPKELMLAVANTKSKTIAKLQSTPPTTARNAHLSPGGDVVLTEVTEGAGQPKKTGRLVLFDANTGRQIQEVSDPAARDQYFLTVSPSGQAIYHSGETYSFVGLKGNFGTQAVIHVLDSSYPSVFFADR
jgi:hypothetical protein